MKWETKSIHNPELWKWDTKSIYNPKLWKWDTKSIYDPEVFHFVNGIRKSFTYGVVEYGIQFYSHYEVLFCIRSKIFVFIVDIFGLKVNVNYGTYD